MVQFKRKRIKTGPNSWINITQRQDGTTHRSVSNRSGSTTTNISNNGVRRTQNNNGWVQRSFWSYKPKKRTNQKQSSFKWIWPSNKKKTSFDSAAFANKLEAAAERMENSKANCENWSSKEWTTFIIVVTIICFIIQIAMR